MVAHVLQKRTSSKEMVRLLTEDACWEEGIVALRAEITDFCSSPQQPNKTDVQLLDGLKALIMAFVVLMMDTRLVGIKDPLLTVASLSPQFH